MLTYDTTDPHSLDNLSHWRGEFLQQVGGPIASLSNQSAQFPFVVVGNKCDKTNDRAVPLERAQNWCVTASQGLGMGARPLPHFETSAKTAINVDEAFQEVARLALQYQDFKQANAAPKLFVPPSNSATIDLQRQGTSMNSRGDRNEACC